MRHTALPNRGGDLFFWTAWYLWRSLVRDATGNRITQMGVSCSLCSAPQPPARRCCFQRCISIWPWAQPTLPEEEKGVQSHSLAQRSSQVDPVLGGTPKTMGTLNRIKRFSSPAPEQWEFKFLLLLFHCIFPPESCYDWWLVCKSAWWVKHQLSNIIVLCSACQAQSWHIIKNVRLPGFKPWL